MKKITGLLLAIIMLLALCVPWVGAAEAGDEPMDLSTLFKESVYGGEEEESYLWPPRRCGVAVTLRLRGKGRVDGIVPMV